MGTRIDQEDFDERDYPRFRQRLQESLSVLGQLLQQPGFGAGPATIGAELELFLIDRAARPLPCNQAIRALAADPRVTVELDRFNLELNASPVPLAGLPVCRARGRAVPAAGPGGRYGRRPRRPTRAHRCSAHPPAGGPQPEHDN